MEKTVKIQRNFKGGEYIVIDNFKFVKHEKPRNETTSWRCSKRSCRARIATVNEKLVKADLNHNHEATVTQYTILKENCNMDALVYSTVNAMDIINEKIKNAKGYELMGLTTKDFMTIRNSMYRNRRLLKASKKKNKIGNLKEDTNSRSENERQPHSKNEEKILKSSDSNGSCSNK